jgi:hypothetical protein
MGSYKRVFDPLDLEIIDLVYETALVQIAARDPLSDPVKDWNHQEAGVRGRAAWLRRVRRFAGQGSRVRSQILCFPGTPPPASEIDGEGVKRPA